MSTQRIRLLTLYHNGCYHMFDPEIISSLGLKDRQEVDQRTLYRAIDLERERMRAALNGNAS